MSESSLHLSGSVWVEENELIPGQLLIFLGAAHGKVLTFTLAAQGKPNPCKPIELPGDLSGPLTGDLYEANHIILYAPCGNQMTAFDTTTATSESPASQLFNLHMHGEVSGRLVRCNLSGHGALLGLDNTGLLIAIDNSPTVPDLQRTMGSWALDGMGVGCTASTNCAYVALAEGRVLAADLVHPGQILWRAPATGSFATLASAPAIGQRGIYIADSQGILHCLDAHTGKDHWRVDLGSPPSAGILAQEGRIYVPLRNGVIACYEEGDE